MARIDSDFKKPEDLAEALFELVIGVNMMVGYFDYKVVPKAIKSDRLLRLPWKGNIRVGRFETRVNIDFAHVLSEYLRQHENNIDNYFDDTVGYYLREVAEEWVREGDFDDMEEAEETANENLFMQQPYAAADDLRDYAHNLFRAVLNKLAKDLFKAWDD